MTFPHVPDDKPPACESCDDTGYIEFMHEDPATGRLVVDRTPCACGTRPALKPGDIVTKRTKVTYLETVGRKIRRTTTHVEAGQRIPTKSGATIIIGKIEWANWVTCD